MVVVGWGGWIGGAPYRQSLEAMGASAAVGVHSEEGAGSIPRSLSPGSTGFASRLAPTFRGGEKRGASI